MRVTNSMMISNMIRNISKNTARMDSLQENMATGKKFSKPSDDPIGVSRSLRLNTEVSNLEQYKKNAEDGQSWLDTTEMAVDNMVSILQRARELAVQAINDTNTTSERGAISAEISQLREQLIGVGNTTYAGSYIFSGYKTNTKLFDEAGKYLVDTVPASATPSPLATNEIINFNVGVGDKIAINFVGQRIFGAVLGGKTIDDNVYSAPSVATGDSSQLIGVFDQMITDLQANDSTALGKAITRIDLQFKNVNAIRAEIGVKTNRLELTLNRIEDDSLNIQDLLSKNEDADMTEVIMRLKMQENVYKASLSAGADIIQPSLVDFLR